MFLQSCPTSSRLLSYGRAFHRIRRKVRFQSVLDLPSGAGRFLPILAEFNVSVTAMDTPAAMLQEGRRYAKLFHRPYGAIVGSAFDVPLADDAIDVVLCARLLHHFPDARPRIDIITKLAHIARYGITIFFFDATLYYGWRRRRRTLRICEKEKHAIQYRADSVGTKARQRDLNYWDSIQCCDITPRLQEQHSWCTNRLRASAADQMILEDGIADGK